MWYPEKVDRESILCTYKINKISYKESKKVER